MTGAKIKKNSPSKFQITPMNIGNYRKTVSGSQIRSQMNRPWVHPQHDPATRFKVRAVDLEMLRCHLNIAKMPLQQVGLIHGRASGNFI